jgi:hypothetical protein
MFSRKKGAKRRSLWGTDWYKPAPKDLKKVCNHEERIQHGSKSQFGSEKEEELYRDYLLGSTIVQISITFCSRLRIEQGSSHWKDIGQ